MDLPKQPEALHLATKPEQEEEEEDDDDEEVEGEEEDDDDEEEQEEEEEDDVMEDPEEIEGEDAEDEAEEVEGGQDAAVARDSDEEEESTPLSPQDPSVSFTKQDPPSSSEHVDVPAVNEEVEDDHNPPLSPAGYDKSPLRTGHQHEAEEESPEQPLEEIGLKKEPEQQKPPGGEKRLRVGGNIDTQAFCLLDGLYQTPDEPQSKHRVKIPLTRLPAVLGRSHTTGDRNFFSLGRGKALSRQHCVISYRDCMGGKLVSPKLGKENSNKKSSEKDAQKLEYESGTPFSFWAPHTKEGGKEEQSDTSVEFPEQGSFVLEVLGKNPVLVGRQRVGPGEVALLSQGTPIRMSTYSLYFLLPTDTPTKPQTIDIPLASTSTSSPPEKVATSPPAADNNKSKKRNLPSPKDTPQPKVKKAKAPPFAQLQAELDSLDIDTLMERMKEAVEGEKWERKHQLIGSTISLHAVRDATAAPRIRELAKNGGVARTEIMNWIAESPKYSFWVEQMMSKMEAKSYQNTITKSLLKAGNVRTGSGGRYIKWVLPGVELNPKSSNDEEGDKEQGGEEDEDEDEGGVGGDDDQDEENHGNLPANSDADEHDDDEEKD